ncbi:MAG: hypothetical protein DCC71_05225 [Proteobacteria bacterium]|nr:MAG: hypothetical protein DCC71_05225 [Pseudomonadota bacterium]
MQRLRLAIAALTLLAVPLTGCETKRVVLELASFGTESVEGIWLWRLSEQSGVYERACRIPFGAIVAAGGGETLPYAQECNDGHAGLALESDVERAAEDPDTIRVALWYMRWEEPGTYKVSTYGADGESALSSTTLDL